MKIEEARLRALIGEMAERIILLEAALDRCRLLADMADSRTAQSYCLQIEDVASTALRQPVRAV